MKALLRLNSIKAKILLGFSIIIVLVLFLGVFNFISVNKINNDTEAIVDEQIPILIADERLAFNISQQIALTRGYMLYGDTDYRTEFYEYTASSVDYQNAVLDATDSEEVKALIDKSIEWNTLVTTQVFVAYEEGRVDEAKRLMLEEVQPIARELMEGFEQISLEREALINQDGQAIISSGTTQLYVGLGVSTLVLILGILAGLGTAQIIANPIKKVAERMKIIANGDLSQEKLDQTSNDEVGQLVEATNEMNDSMRGLLRQINSVSETVSAQSEELTQSASEVKAGSEQIAVTMQEIASGTESQATNASDLSTKMQSFTGKVQEVNANGENIYQSSNHVLSLTTDGWELMNASVEQMASIDSIVQDAVNKVKGLDAQSQQISKLVAVIRDIAEQTNLLALNAAIEAARAGEQGRGFAVVADEVRKLADQVGESVTDITEIVVDIQRESSVVTQSLENGYQEVEKGTGQIKTTGETFAKITDAVNDMFTNIETITEHLSSMSAETEEMNTSIEEIASISEESAAGVEETSASAQQSSSSMMEVSESSEQLAKLAEELNGLVRQFKL